MFIITAASDTGTVSSHIDATDVQSPHRLLFIIFIMKAIFVLSVLLSAVLALAAAAAVGAVEPAEAAVELQKESQVEAAEPAQAPVEPQEENQEGEPEVFSASKVAEPIEGRFFFCPSGWERYRNTCYLFVRSSRSWSSAMAYCDTLGATLPSAHDLFDYSFLQSMTSRAGYTTSWMGGMYFQGWRWVDRTNFGYQNWYSHNSVSSYPCVYLNTALGWSNSNCASSRAFICQRRSDAC